MGKRSLAGAPWTSLPPVAARTWHLAVDLLVTVTFADQGAAVDEIRRFFKLHATCGGFVLDTPPLPNGGGYRVVAACRCGDTTEHWLMGTLLSPQELVTAVSPRND
jgi:hypothetical protein